MGCGKKGTIIDFIADACKSTDLTSIFVSFDTPEEFEKWLEENHYSFEKDEAEKLLRARKDHLSNAEVGIKSY